VRTEHITVDVNSITIRREDIPDSLFTIEFPEGARVYNSIIGVATEGRWTSSLKQELIINDSLEELAKEDSEQQAHTSEQLKEESLTQSSLRVSDKPPPNEPTQPVEPNTGPILSTYPVGKQGLSNLVWILISACVAGFALTVIVLIFRSPSGDAKGREIR